MKSFKGKQLNIESDCSYSGNWIKDCVNTLDDLGIPSCGHHTRKQGILIKIWCSCGTNEEATALCYVTEATELDETNKGVFIHGNKKLSSGQTTKFGNFTIIRCTKMSTETCELDSTCTWEDRFCKAHIVYLVRGNNRGLAVWHYVWVDEDKVEAFKAKVKSGIIDVADCGKVLKSGWGQYPPKDVEREMGMRFMPLVKPEKTNVNEEDRRAPSSPFVVLSLGFLFLFLVFKLRS